MSDNNFSRYPTLYSVYQKFDDNKEIVKKNKPHRNGYKSVRIYMKTPDGRLNLNLMETFSDVEVEDATSLDRILQHLAAENGQ